MDNVLTDIERDTLNTAFVTGIKHIDAKILAAIKNTDRSLFVRPQDKKFAYEDHPLDIGYGQTISQPFIVALMTHLVEPQISDKVLEVGSGSGYVIAVLSKLVKEVYGIEIVAELATRSQQIMKELHISNATIMGGDGNQGLSQHAPFDKIMLSAATSKLPDRLLEELNIGGILVFPKSMTPSEQMLTRIKKLSANEFKLEDILPVRFVPLVNSASIR